MNFVRKPEKVQKKAIGSSRVRGVFGTTISECLYRSAADVRFRCELSMVLYCGAFLGPTLAFMTSTPMINPIALLLALAFWARKWLSYI